MRNGDDRPVGDEDDVVAAYDGVLIDAHLTCAWPSNGLLRFVDLEERSIEEAEVIVRRSDVCLSKLNGIRTRGVRGLIKFPNTLLIYHHNPQS